MNKKDEAKNLKRINKALRLYHKANDILEDLMVNGEDSDLFQEGLEALDKSYQALIQLQFAIEMRLAGEKADFDDE